MRRKGFGKVVDVKRSDALGEEDRVVLVARNQRQAAIVHHILRAGHSICGIAGIAIDTCHEGVYGMIVKAELAFVVVQAHFFLVFQQCFGLI